MPINDRIDKFFVTAADLEIPGELVPRTSKENHVKHLIDGSEYFGELRKEVNSLKAPGSGNRFFYFTNWVLMLVDFKGTQPVGGVGLPSAWNQGVGTLAFRLDDSSGDGFDRFLEELAAMSANGVDVRALSWVHPFVLNVQQFKEKEGNYNRYAATLLSIKALREESGMAYKAILNLVAHPAGSVHTKMVICGDDTNARGYTSGMDFEPLRVDKRDHPKWKLPKPEDRLGWHDVGVKVEGPAVDTMYRYFQLLWNEQISRKVERFRFKDDIIPSHYAECEEVPDRTFLSITSGSHHVQVLRTAPQVHIAFGATTTFPELDFLRRLAIGARRPPLSFAPDGIFEFRAALKKAIGAAAKYIYAEDQAFTGREIMDWIHKRLIDKPELKVIFVHRTDPEDPQVMRILRNIAVNEHLAAPGVTNISNRVRFYFRVNPVVIHSKTWIIDDEYVIIGSANAMRRSLYTDCELSVGVLDENEGPGSFSVSYRSDLWAEHCGTYTPAGVYTPADRSAFNNLDRAIRIWDLNWSITGAVLAPSGTLTPGIFVKRRVPFSEGPAPDQFSPPNDPLELPSTEDERKKIDAFYDSRDADSIKEL